MPDSGTPRRVFLHLGLQKTGTSYLQGVVHENVDALAAQGLDLLPATRREAFELMLVLRGRYNPERDPAHAAGALERFSAGLAAARGDRVLLSQESLAAARPSQVRRLLDACGDREPHVVLTVRDLARQLPSLWQQELKSGKTEGWHDYLDRMRRLQSEGRIRHPWIHLDPPAVLDRWAKHVPPERIHVVTVPPPGSPTDLLLARFCQALGVDPATLEPPDRASNTSLGMAQAELLRRVNGELSDEHRRRQVYGDVGKRFFASQVLGRQPGERILVPDEVRGWCTTVAQQQVRAIEEAGYDVVGTLEDLRCSDSAFARHDPSPSEAEVAAVAVSALGSVLAHRAEATLRRRAAQGRGGGLLGRLGRLAGGRREGDRTPDDLEDTEP